MKIISECGKKTYKIISTDGRSNIKKQAPDNLELLAEEGNGVYEITKHLFGAKACNVKGISMEVNSSGLIYFGESDCSRERIKSTLELMGVKNLNHIGDNTNYYYFFMEKARDYSKQFITQARFVSNFAMKYYFKDTERFPKMEQSIGIIDAVCAFVEEEAKEFGGLDNEKLYAFLGTDRVFGSLGLGFGFMVENSYYGIHRIWSRILFYSK